jgi:hypothetical protein
MPNLQSGSTIKALVCFVAHPDDPDYVPEDAMASLQLYMKGECKLDDDGMFACLESIQCDPKQFLRDEMYGELVTDSCGIEEVVPGLVGKKAVLALSIGLDILKLYGHMEEGCVGPQPFLATPVGNDANCSGAGNSAMVCNNPNILQRTGWSPYNVKDVYNDLTDRLANVGFPNGSRDLSKPLWNGGQYGQGAKALTKLKPKVMPGEKAKSGSTDKIALHNYLAKGERFVSIKEAIKVHDTLMDAFGKPTVNVMKQIAASICKTMKVDGELISIPLVTGDLVFKTPEG